MKPNTLIQSWLDRQLPESARQWLADQFARGRSEPSRSHIQIILGLAPRKLGREDLELHPSDQADAHRARPGWDPTNWTVDQAARIAALCEHAPTCRDFPQLFTYLCRSADVQEAVALYQGLPLYPLPDQLEPQAGEGLRTNLRSVFEAVAHRSPYPREQFDENRWNQMVLKALFIESTLQPIQGLDERANPTLARILRDYAHERWAAGRSISPELWRCVGPFADDDALADIERLIDTGTDTERQAGALALSANSDGRAEPLKEKVREHMKSIEAGALTWRSLLGQCRA
jgi:hypothetical protein